MIAFFLALAALVSSWSTVVPINSVDWITALNSSPSIVWMTGAMLAISALVWSSDKWLGLLLVYIVLNALRTPWMARPASAAMVIVLSAFAFVVLREKPPEWARALLVWSAALQVPIAAIQIWGYDPLWGQKGGENMVLGTIGQQTHFGALCAIVGAMAPWKVVPVFVLGVVLSGSRLAWLALGAALICRVWQRERT